MKKFLILIIVSLLSFSQVAIASFSDVSSSTDYQEAILWMSDNGVIDGYPDGTFKPDRCVNRVELLKMLFEMMGVDVYESDYQLFPDTYADQWYTPYVRTARERGTVVGYPDGNFRPAQCVNRVEAIKMAVLEFNNGEVPEFERGLWSVSDVNLNEWYGPYFEYAFFTSQIGRNHMEGPPGSIEEAYYYPAESMTRKEVAEMLYRMKTVKDNNLDVYDSSYKPESIERVAKLYLGKGFDGDYSLVDFENGNEIDFIPEGYEVVDQHSYSYDNFPFYLILQKENNLYSYNVEAQNLKEISNLEVKDSEKVRVYPSISEKKGFFLEINEYGPDEEFGMGLPSPIATYSYFYNASSNELLNADNIDYDECLVYDSKYDRFFAWRCAEGIGNSIPLVTMNFDSEVVDELVSLEDYGLTEDDLGLISANYNNEKFFTLSKG
ncbi:hypothetical protein GF366_01145, partial [Candidatus Peregrinibacteria bacterium]|nr:hypothetical protein [Candidatus Peregrinibacteria bacterium]